jgi:hypothetical protein
MSNFLMVIPMDWSELADGHAFVMEQGEATILGSIESGGIAAIEAILQDTGAIAPTASISDFKMFKDVDIFRVWYKLIP